MFITEFRKHLISKDAIKDVVGDRVFPKHLPQDQKKPAIVYFDSGSTRNISYLNQGTKLYRIQLNVIDTEYLRAKKLAQQIIEIYHGSSGLIGTNQVLLGELVNEFDLFQDQLNEIVIELEFEVI